MAGTSPFIGISEEVKNGEIDINQGKYERVDFFFTFVNNHM